MRLVSGSDGVTPLSTLGAGWRGVVCRIAAHDPRRVDRLHALGVTAGAPITILQTFPGVVFLCDQTELAVERSVAEIILVRTAEG
jgi:Fe2+ transport system protein FeoA